MQHESGAGRGEGGERFARRHGGGAPAGARQHEGLRHLGQRQLAFQRSRCGGEGRDARSERIGNAERIEAAQLLADRAPHREIAGMEPRNVVAGAMRRLEFGDDLIEAHWRGVDDARPFGAHREDLGVDERAGIEADRAARDELCAAQRDEVRRAWTGTDEMHGHGFTAVHCVTVIAGRNACLPPTASRRSTERRVSVPPNLLCAASTALSVSTVMALATMRPPGFSAA